MSEELLPRVFASLQTLERHFDLLKKSKRKEIKEDTLTAKDFTQFEDAIKRMRRIANALQIEVAQNNRAAVHRSLRLFYGLQFMVRPEILKAAALSIPGGKQQTRKVSVDIQPAFYH